PAGSGADHLEPAPRRGARVVVQHVGCAMRGYDLLLVRDAELVEHVRGVFHRRPVALRAHDDADQCAHVLPFGPAARRSRSPTASPSPAAGGNAAITTST